MTKPKKQNIHGVLLLDKPYGISSNKAVQIAKYIFSAAKCGHTGTLDPVATGLLPLCFGEATKFSSILLDASKTYYAQLKLGFLSSTGDVEGEILRTEAADKEPSRYECEHVLKQFVGTITQVPPMHSALKYRGKPLYAYARSGETIERQAREITIHNIRIESLMHNELHLSIACGSGTYIRTLAEDIGKALGCGGAYLTALRRTEIGGVDISQAQSLPKLEALDASTLKDCLLPIDSFLTGLPSITLDETSALHLIQGRAVPYSRNDDVSIYPALTRIYDDTQRFLGLGEITAERTIISKRLLSNDYFAQ